MKPACSYLDPSLIANDPEGLRCLAYWTEHCLPLFVNEEGRRLYLDAFHANFNAACGDLHEYARMAVVEPWVVVVNLAGVGRMHTACASRMRKYGNLHLGRPASYLPTCDPWEDLPFEHHPAAQRAARESDLQNGMTLDQIARVMGQRSREAVDQEICRGLRRAKRNPDVQEEEDFRLSDVFRGRTVHMRRRSW